MLDVTTESNTLLIVADEVLRLNGRLRSIFAGVAEGTGLSPMGSAVLAAVVQAGHPPTVAQIGRSLGHPRQVIQRAANELSAAGLITPTPNPDHKRAALLAMTESGRDLKDKMDTRATRAANAVFATIGRDRAEQLAEALQGFRRDVEAYLRGAERV